MTRGRSHKGGREVRGLSGRDKKIRTEESAQGTEGEARYGKRHADMKSKERA